MDGPAKGGSDQHPEGTGKVAELGRQDRANQGAGTGNRGKVMAEHDPAVRRNKVFPVGVADCRRAAFIVERQDIGQQPCGMEAVSDGKCADPGNYQPESIHWFSPGE